MSVRAASAIDPGVMGTAGRMLHGDSVEVGRTAGDQGDPRARTVPPNTTINP
jgi:hypothetical protein